MERWKKQAARLLLGMTLQERADPSVCPFVPSKTQMSAWPRTRHHTATPERHGVSSKRLLDMLHAFEAEARAELRTVYVVKDGYVLLDASRMGFDSHIPYLSHSMAKSVTGMLIGTLVDEGTLSLTDAVAGFFPEYTYKDRRFASMTVEHLLIMSSGVPFAEVGVVTEADWGRAFFSSTLNFAPGEEFMYNSMNSYILGRIAEKVSGKELMTLAEERLFAPLGITDAFWERDAQGHAKGGFGLYLSASAWAKLGSLYVTGGMYHGHRVLSESWITQSSATHMATPPSLGDFDYGYHVWVNRMGGEVLFNGMLGQNVWIRPQSGMVAVLMAGNSELFQQSPALSLLRTYMFDLPNGEHARMAVQRQLRHAQRDFFRDRLPVKPKAPVRTLRTWLLGQSCYPFDDAWERVLDSYTCEDNAAALLPMFVRLMQNNYESTGLRTLTLKRENNELRLCCEIGESCYELPVGLYGYADGVLSVRGEMYLVRTLGGVSTNDEGETVYTIELVFPELPNTRQLTLRVCDDCRVELTFSECPDQRLLESFRQSFLSPGAKGSMAFGLLQRAMGENFLEEKAATVFQKMVRAGRTSHPDTVRHLQQWAQEKTTRVNKYAAIQALFAKFVGTEEDEESERPTTKDKPSWLGGVMSSLFQRTKMRTDEPPAPAATDEDSTPSEVHETPEDAPSGTKDTE